MDLPYIAFMGKVLIVGFLLLAWFERKLKPDR